MNNGTHIAANRFAESEAKEIELLVEHNNLIAACRRLIDLATAASPELRLLAVELMRKANEQESAKISGTFEAKDIPSLAIGVLKLLQRVMETRSRFEKIEQSASSQFYARDIEKLLAATVDRLQDPFERKRTLRAGNQDDEAQWLIKCENVSSVLSPSFSIKNVSLTISPREIVAFVGENGCGKTSLLRIIGGVGKISSGRVHYKRHTARLNGAERVIKVFYWSPEYAAWEGTIEQGLVRSAFGNGLSPDGAAEAIEAVLAQYDLEDKRAHHLYQLSTGQRLRAHFARLAILAADVVILDEPLANLSPRGRVEFCRELLAMTASSRRNTAVALSSHHLTDVEAIADRIFLLDRGQIIADEVARPASDGTQLFLVTMARGVKLPDSLLKGQDVVGTAHLLRQVVLLARAHGGLGKQLGNLLGNPESGVLGVEDITGSIRATLLFPGLVPNGETKSDGS